MLEIIARVENIESTGSIELDKAIATIRTEIQRGNTASHNIARELYRIKKDKLFTAVGAEHFSDFAENYFGISKSQGSRLCSIAEKFLVGTTKYEDFSNTQLIAMMNASDEILEYIKPTMTVNDIRKYIKGAIEQANKPKALSDTAPADTAPDGTAPADTAPDGTAPADTAPTDTAPDGTAPDGTAPADTAPDGTAPDGTAHADTAPDGTAPIDMTKAHTMHFTDEKELSAFLIELAKNHDHITNIIMTYIPVNSDKE